MTAHIAFSVVVLAPDEADTTVSRWRPTFGRLETPDQARLVWADGD